MSIEKMEQINLVGLMSDLDRTFEKCLESGCFHIIQPVEEQDGMRRLEAENPYKELLKNIVSADTGGVMGFSEVDDNKIKGLIFEDIEADFNVINEKLKVHCKEIEELSDMLTTRKQAYTQLSHLKDLDIDMSKLFQCSHIKIRFGRLPSENEQKLSYYENKTFEFVPYDDDGNYKWGIYFAPADSVAEADRIFKSLYFERIWIPNFVSETPEKESERLKTEIKQLEEQLTKKEQEYKAYINEIKDKLNCYFCRVKYLYDLFELRKYALVYKNKFYLSGFIPKSQKQKFEKLFEPIESVSIVSKAAENNDDVKVPVKLKTNRFSKPFSMFVEMYGLPSYNGFNPTTLVAITYTLMFGIMFGDLGQGLVISLIGLIVYKKTGNKLGAIMQRIGISSAIFGLLYGSVFGFEDLLDPLYKFIGLSHKPLEIMESTMTILLGAICIGVVIILISIIINICISLKHRDFSAAVFGNNGLAGLIFFAALLAGIAVMMTGKGSLFTTPYVIFLIVLPLILMFFREPLGCLISGKKFNMEGGIGDFIASNFFEVFEFILGYATNTLSFVRIGGFIFSHAGMMSVVMLLSESVAAGASPIVIVIGNIFVMGMEGLIVGIQVLRLEFYEVFSRFYDGDGVAFEPIKVSYDINLD